MKCCLAFLLLQILVHSANDTLQTRGTVSYTFSAGLNSAAIFRNIYIINTIYPKSTMDNCMPNHTHLFIAAHTMCETTFLRQANNTNRTTWAQICSEWCFACSCFATLSQCITGQFKYLHPIYYKSQRIEIQLLNNYQGSWYYCGEECQQVTKTYNHYVLFFNTNM